MQDRLKGYTYAERVRCETADAAAASGELFDLIVCDAPCSGTGTLARNPEIRHRFSEGDLPRQAERQRAIVSAAVRRLAPGGRIVYSTCSLEPEENEQVADAALGGLRRVPVQELMKSLRLAGVLRDDVDLSSAVREGALRTLPGVHPGDGFFAVVAERSR
jgi:16S rRNA (cytosine967-C5)-methyltransferase